MANEDDIVAFISDFWSFDPAKIDHSDVLKSMRIDGDDAFEFIEAFGEKFSVNVAAYIWDFHHDDEGGLLTPFWFLSPHARVRRIPITVPMLIGFAKRGVWDLDYPAHQPARRWDIHLNNAMFAGIGLAVLGVYLWVKYVAG